MVQRPEVGERGKPAWHSLRGENGKTGPLFKMPVSQRAARWRARRASEQRQEQIVYGARRTSERGTAWVVSVPWRVLRAL